MNKIRCSLWYCFREFAGYIQLSAGEITKKIPYCEKHGKIAQEVIKEDYPNGLLKVAQTENEK